MTQNEYEVLQTQFEGLLKEYAEFFEAEKHGCMPTEKLEALLGRCAHSAQHSELKAEFREILDHDSERARDFLAVLRNALAQARDKAVQRHRTTYHPLNPLDEILKDDYRARYKAEKH